MKTLEDLMVRIKLEYNILEVVHLKTPLSNILCFHDKLKIHFEVDVSSKN